MFCGDEMVSDGPGVFIFYGPKLFLSGTFCFTYVFSCEVVHWAFPVVDYNQFSEHLELDLLKCMSKHLMVLVPLKETLTLYFARMCVYCSLRPLMYRIFYDVFYKLSCGWVLLFDGFSVRAFLVKRTVLGSGCLTPLTCSRYFKVTNDAS